MLSGVNEGEIYLPRPPIPAQKEAVAALAPVGRLLGYKYHYPKYSAAEAQGAVREPAVHGEGDGGESSYGGLVLDSILVLASVGAAPEQRITSPPDKSPAIDLFPEAPKTGFAKYLEAA
jgi:hypothetical protein